jgi:hypothetical protein
VSAAQNVCRCLLTLLLFGDGTYAAIFGRLYARTHGGSSSGLIEGPIARVFGVLFIAIAISWGWKIGRQEPRGKSRSPNATAK